MRNRLLRWILYLAVFVGGVAGFSNLSLLQHQQTVSASDLTDPTLPVMCIDIGGKKINRMFGFTMEMDAKNMREALIPMTTKRSITVSYKAYRNNVRSVSYEVSAPDTGTVIENAKIGNFQTDGDYRTATFTLSEPILMNREYPIRFTIQTETQDVYFYARIIQRSDPVTEKYVQFVYDFYEGCINQNGASDLNTYLETDDTITNNSFTNVNLKSSLRQVTWGNLNPQIYRKAIPTIRDIYGETCSLTTDYLISAEGDSGQEIYRVHEYYRLRYYNARMMLLNFNRSAQQVFEGTSDGAVSASGINVGVADRDIQYRTNETSDTVAFVQDHELWEYNGPSEKLARVFSMHDTGRTSDERHDNCNYGFRIIRASEGGGLDFLVYGHMSRGQHEGQMGVSVCHYNAETTAVTERAFIPYTRSFELLEKDIEKLGYINKSNEAYLYLARAVIRVDLTNGEATPVLEDIDPDCFVASGYGSEIAWMEEMSSNSSTDVTLMSLDTGEMRSIEADEGSYIRVIGFLNHDFIYGLARAEDILRDASGAVTFAMNELKIEDLSGTLVKDYRPDGLYVTDVGMEPGLASLTRVRKEGVGYAEAPGDNIINNRQTENSSVSVVLSNSSRQGVVLTLKLPSAVRNVNPTVANFRMRYARQTNSDYVIDQDDHFRLFYVYGGGRLISILTDPAEAVRLADENVGTVLSEDWQYIYERGNKQTKNELHNPDIPEAFLSGTLDADVLDSLTGDDVSVLNLSGCTLDQVLYEVSQGRAVATRLADGSNTVIVGYDRYNTLLYNFETGDHYYMGINDSTASMLSGGNLFVTYTEKQATIKAD